MRRGDIWWADLGQPHGSAPAFRHPVVIVSADTFNASRIRTVIIAVLTSNLRLAQAPANVLLHAPEGGLEHDSVVNVSQLATIDKTNLTEKVGALSPATMQQVDTGLRTVCDLLVA